MDTHKTTGQGHRSSMIPVTKVYVNNEEVELVNYDDEYQQLIEEAEYQQKIMDYLNTFESEHGKRVLKDLKRQAGYNAVKRPPMDSTGKIDPLAMAREEAQRSVIVYIEDKLTKDLNEERGMKHE